MKLTMPAITLPIYLLLKLLSILLRLLSETNVCEDAQEMPQSRSMKEEKEKMNK